MTVVISGIAFLALLTLLVIVHEFGHYLAAVWSRVRVEEFGFGIPPRAMKLFSYKETLFSLNYIPFGGFVRLQGENSLDPNERERAGSFAAASIPARLFILVAGVCMNLLVAVLLFTFGFWLWNWVPTYLTLDELRGGEARGEVQVDWSLYISEVVDGAPAATAGIKEGGVLTAVDGTPVTCVDEVLGLQEGKHLVTYTVKYPETNGGEEFAEEETVKVNLKDGKAGVALSPFALDLHVSDRSFFTGVTLALRETWTVTVGTVKGVGVLLKSLAFEQRVPPDIAGIVGIAQLTYTSVQEGFMKYLRLVALLSLSLAVLNILPFPALDGGRILFVAYELLLRRPVNRRVEVITNGVGIALIMALMIAVTWNDILRIISSS